MLIKFSSLTLLVFISLIMNAYPQATVEAPPGVNAGAEFKVNWSGPDNKGDFVTVVKEGAEEGKYGNYAYTKKGNPLTLRAPDEPGNYEVRYLENKTRITLGSIPLKVLETPASLSAPPNAPAGSEIKIIWEGPDNRGDFITAVKEGTEERKYGRYVYTKKGSPAELRLPDEPGKYEIRYLTGQKYYTLASLPITVEATSASIEIPPGASAGSEIDVKWTGPDNKGDFITIVKQGTEEKEYGNYTYTRKGSPLKLKIPDEPGSYEVRYLSAQSRKTVASMPITVTSVSAALEFPSKAVAGSDLEVKWEGPDNKGDFITVVKEGAEEKEYGNYAYTRKGSPLNIRIPDEEGLYEVRYLMGKSRNSLASLPLQVVPPSASLSAPDDVVSKQPFKVEWEGPDNRGDFIAVFKPGADKTEYESYAYTRRGNPLKIMAPELKGVYKIRYLMGKSHKSLAEVEINVLESRTPGTLKVVTSPDNTARNSPGAVELILDASGSMLQRLEGKRRIDIAKNAVTKLVESSLEPGTPFAMRVFGHREADSCRTDLEVALSPLEREKAVSKISSINAMNLAKTPIAKSLSMVENDLAGIEGKAVVILVTDGEETCEGDPVQAIESLKAAGYDIRVNIVGFAIDELMLKDTFREWASAGNGSYFDAGDAEELSNSIREALEIPFEVLDSENEVVATGSVNGKPVEVVPGTYSLKILSDTTETIRNVEIEPESEKVVTFE